VLVAEPDQSRRAGLGYGLAAYGLWGVLPLYFVALAPATPTEILGWRIVLSLVFCVLLLAIGRQLRPALDLLRTPRIARLTAIAGVLILINWGIFVIATRTDHVVDAALGYFINPLVTAFLGVVILREKLRVAQWVALGVGALAVVVLMVGYGQFPWIALGLAFSFGFYGFVKKRLGDMPALTGLTLETLWVTPLALLMLGVGGARQWTRNCCEWPRVSCVVGKCWNRHIGPVTAIRRCHKATATFQRRTIAVFEPDFAGISGNRRLSRTHAWRAVVGTWTDYGGPGDFCLR